ncbi:MAG TPA: IgGFc-binding protein, partial [Acidimicrobiales bacterium]|nr:IgGFc-binding protein [Acidimicrobiales bacterium]
MPGAIAVLAFAVSLLVVSTPPPAGATPTTAGSDFWVGFTQNVGAGAALTLFISSGSTTTGTVAPNGGASIPFSVTPGHVTSVPIPTSYEMATTDGIENKGIHVTAKAPISVYGLNDITATTDAFLALPTSSEGTRYRTLGYSGGAGGGLAVVATANGTTVTITPSETVGSHTINVPFTEHLAAGQTYELQGIDLSGSLVTSNLPISVYGYNGCTDIPAGSYACDTVMEQMPPTSSYGTEFVAERLALRLHGDTYRVLADQNGTVVKVNGTTVATLAAGKFYEAQLPAGETAANNDGLEITTSHPALVAQYSNGQSLDGVPSDPMEMLIPPFEQFQNSYTVATPTGVEAFSPNFINVVVPTNAISSFKLDGAGVASSKFKAIGTSGFSGAQLTVNVGSHTLVDGSNFGAFVYG